MTRPPAGARSGGPPAAAPSGSLGGRNPVPFEVGGVLGRGGMGEVRAAYDPRLEREVAVKTVAPGDTHAAARLAREARLTARLEHPGIVPVYEAGRGEDGRPWYAMRLFTGRPLADVLAATPAPADRLRLVRHVLDAAYAMAYAHEQGILHRDLTPNNILTGPFGETMVVDWGLACTLEEARVSEPGVGTPGYMSPEQRVGGALDARGDVYALGAVLVTVLTGRAPEPGAGLRGAEGIPPELAAIAERALRADPAARYADARAFADDLLAWFEGRRVAAHAYTPSELLRRLVVAWRVPLLVAAGGLAAVAVATAIGIGATAEERARAEASEAETERARADEQRAFAAALRVQAGLAAAEGLAMEAEILAAHALRRDDVPEARGVLAASYGRPRWSRTAVREAPACRRTTLSRDGRHGLCLRKDTVFVFDVATGQIGRTLEGAFTRGLLLQGGDVAVLIDDLAWLHVWDEAGGSGPIVRGGAMWTSFSRTARADLVAVQGTLGEIVVELSTRATTSTNRCGTGVGSGAVALTEGGDVVVACNDGRVLVGPVGSPGRELVRVPDADGVPTFLENLDGDRLLVGTATGHALVYDLAGGLLARRRLGAEAAFVASSSGDRVAMGLAGGDVVVWDLATNVVQMRFRGGILQTAWLPDGTLRLVGARSEDRRAPNEVRPHRTAVGAGVSALAWAPDGHTLAVAGGDGVTTLLDPRSGATLRRLEVGTDVVKDVAFSPDGVHLIAASAGNAHRVWAVPTGAEVAAPAGFGARRAAWFAQAGPHLVPYATHLWSLSLADGALTKMDHGGLVDLEGNGAGTHAVGIAADGGVTLFSDGPTVTWRELGKVVGTTGAASAGDDAFVSTDQEVLRYSSAGEVTWRAPAPRDTTDLAVSADGRWAALGRLDGTVMVYLVGETEPRAKLIGHHARVSALAFAHDGQWLASGAWDGETRIWSVAAFEADAAGTAEVVEAAWGATLEDVLGTVALPEVR